MATYTLQVTCYFTVDVEADTLGKAKRKLREAVDGHEASLGMLDDEPLIVSLEIEGSIDEI